MVEMAESQWIFGLPTQLRQFDATRDVQGFFYTPASHRIKYQELKQVLEEKLETKLSRNSNTWNSCFQYNEPKTTNGVYRRIKIYNKCLQLFQSKTSSMSVGMNTNALFTPTMRMLSELKETADAGLSRIEISYYADSDAAQRKLLDSNFCDTIQMDLNKVHEALNSVEGLCYHVDLYGLMVEFK